MHSKVSLKRLVFLQQSLWRHRTTLVENHYIPPLGVKSVFFKAFFNNIERMCHECQALNEHLQTGQMLVKIQVWLVEMKTYKPL